MITVRGPIFSYLITVFTVLLLFTVTPVFADAVGKFTYIDGRVDILTTGQDRAVPVEVGAPASLKDIVRTKSNSRAEITFNDGTVVRLAQSSRVEISSYLFDENGARKAGTLTLSRGKIRAMISGGTANFEVHTPNAKADINGSNFYFIHEKGSTWFYASDGSLRVLSKENPDRLVLIESSNCIWIAPGRPILDSCIYKEIDERKHMWDTATSEKAPVVAQLPAEGEVFTYTPLGGRAIDTPSLPVPIATEDLVCTQCPFDIPLEPVAEAPSVKMGDWERIDDGCPTCEVPEPPEPTFE